MEQTVVGADIGATSTKALAITEDGTTIGRGRSGGANPNSHPPDVAAKRVAEAIRDALGGADGATVQACVLGLAGVSKFSDAAVVEEFENALRQIGLTCGITAVSDAEVAYASATAAPDGTVLVGGTGSVVARIVDRRKTTQIGGWGWLLGDEGSAFWIGREAVRATLRVLQGSDRVGPLAHAVLAEALGESTVEDRWLLFSRLITAMNGVAPIRLATYAGLVSEHAAADPVAEGIVAEAARLLADQARTAREPGERTPVVLAGSVIGPASPVGVAVRESLAGETEVLFAPDGALGAVWLAALLAFGPDAPRPTVD